VTGPAGGPPSRRPTVVVCGLGPAGPDLVTGAVHAAVARIPHRYLRTTRHPAAPVVGEAVGFDDRYERAERLADVYAGIVEDLVAAAEAHGEVLYAVPGSPVVAERTVELLVADERVAVELVAGLSFADLAWVRLGVDPVARGVRLVDGHRVAVEAAGERGPLLVGQCDTVEVLSDLKLAIAEALEGAGGAAGAAGDHDVVVLQRLGLPDESVATVAWPELDRVVVPDHLTSVYVPRLAAPVAGEVAAFAEVVRRLRAECPWDREQTHQSLRRHLLEEAYEVLEALDHLDVEAGEGFDALEEELGDLLFQVVFHARLAAEEGRFTLADVARGIGDKLVARHPHVFGDATATSADELATTWEQAKVAEKGRDSVMDGIPAALPALLYAQKVQRKAASQGVDWRTLVGDDGELSATARRLLDAVDAAHRAGDDAETELRLGAEHVRDRFRARDGT
jgi:tetrapyrrole methylase family protein/MazG family protein